MRKIGFLALFTALFGHFSMAQQGTFAYALSSLSADEDATQNALGGYKQDVVQGILDDLIEAKGDYQKERPAVSISQTTTKPAWINVSQAQIFVEEKTYDLCRGLGEDSLSALAIIIGHELIHYYEDHDWEEHILRYYGEDSENVTSEAMAKHLDLEFEADHKGGFLAEMAGYASLGVLPKLLPEIYSTYGLTEEKTSLYPSLEQRLKIAEKSEDVLGELNRLFQTSRYFTGIGHYQRAAQYLEHIVLKGKFGSREIFNNLGVLYTLSALQYYSKSEMPYQLPLELDSESRLTRRSNSTERKKLLGIAADKFEAAQRLDKSYVPAQINAAAVMLLLDKKEEADFTISQLRKKLSKGADLRHLSYVHTLEGISNFLEGEKKQAKKSFRLSYDTYASPMTEFNAGIEPSQKPFGNVESEISIGEHPLDQLYSRLMREEEQASAQIALTEDQCYYLIDKGDHEIHVDFQYGNVDEYYFFAVATNLKIGWNSWGKGDSMEMLIKELGHSANCLEGGLILCHFPNYQLMVESSEGKIVRFVKYHSSPR